MEVDLSVPIHMQVTPSSLIRIAIVIETNAFPPVALPGVARTVFNVHERIIAEKET
jgi:hypothetical protein